MYVIFSAKADKYVVVNTGKLQFVSDKEQATVFSSLDSAQKFVSSIKEGLGLSIRSAE